MKHKIFTIFDSKANAFLTPFYLPEQGMAARTFADCINSDTHQFSKHPADYTLYCTGEWDDKTGKSDLFDVKDDLGNGIMYKAKPEYPDQAELLPED